MLIFILLISLANLAIGYIVAVKFHATMFPIPTAERELVHTAADPNNEAPPFTIDASRMPIVPQEPPLVVLPAKVLQDTPETPSPPTANLEVTTPPENEQAAATVSVKTNPGSSESESALTSTASPEETLTAVSVDVFMRGIVDFRAQLSALDQRVRQCAKSPDTRKIEGCVKEFREANSRYLEQSSEVRERLEQAEPGDATTTPSAIDSVQQALATQVEAVRRSEDTLSQLNIEDDPEGSCETLIHTTQSLSSSSHELRDELQLMKRDLLSGEGQSDGQESEPSIDELTQIPSREMFDRELSQQLDRGDAFSLAIVDVDQCGKSNLGYGQAVTDEILKALAQIVAASARGECRAARYTGQQFAVLFPGQKVEETNLALETIRQIIHQTNFIHEDTRIEVSVSIMVTNGNKSDTLSSLEKRAKEGLEAAKDFGRNQTFWFENGVIEPVLPPVLDLRANTYEV